MDVRESFVDRDDIRLRLLQAGSGAHTVVFLHGLAGSAGEFLATVERLPGVRSVLVDLRGHGASTRRPSDLSRRAFVNDVIAVLERLESPVVLAGHSMGAHTAMLVAAERPDLVERLVMLEGGVGGETPTAALDVARWFRSWPVPFASEAAARSFLGDGSLATRWIADLLPSDRGGLQPSFDLEVMAQVAETLATPRWDQWTRVRTPSVVVFAGDSMFTDEQKELLVSRGTAVHRIDLRAGSHDAHLDAVDEWAGALGRFVQPAW